MKTHAELYEEAVAMRDSGDTVLGAMGIEQIMVRLQQRDAAEGRRQRVRVSGPKREFVSSETMLDEITWRTHLSALMSAYDNGAFPDAYIVSTGHLSVSPHPRRGRITEITES